MLFETLGWSDRDWSKKLGAASYELMYKQLGLLMSAKNNVLVETNFHADSSTEKLCALVQRNQYRVLHASSLENLLLE
jgi:hypothetical protein